MRTCLLLVSILAACSDKTTSADSGGGVDRGPTDLALAADPNGLYWDATSNTLYVADQAGNQVITWTDAGQFGAATPLPAAPSGQTELGGIAETSDGTLLTPRFGFATVGGMITDKDGTVGNVPGLDVTRRRLGVAVAADGTIVDTYFVKTTTTIGAVATLTLTGSETDLITTLVKPVGVAVIGTTVYVSDQSANQILAHDLSGAASTGTVFAIPEGPDLMTAGPSGSLFTGSLTGVVYQIDSAGNVTNFQSGLNETRGVAYDAVNQRLFVAEHVATGTTHSLHIYPVNP